MRSAAEPPTSAVEQFKDDVSERSGPKDWRGGLERSHARRGCLGQTIRAAMHGGKKGMSERCFAPRQSDTLDVR